MEFRKHEIRWDCTDADESLQSWLSAIRGGDTLQIIPKAQFQAWINFVQEAEIELHFLEFTQEMSLLPLSDDAISELQHENCYRKLDETVREIRLVRLHPGPSEEPISCSLIYTSLGDPSHIGYECLSYCWGDQKRICNMTLLHLEQHAITGQEITSKHFFPITSSLYSAMKSLRRRNGPARILWIDAICIHQTDFYERSQQVAIMKDIYSQANNVIVWLGDGDEITRKCMHTINVINDRYESFQNENIGIAELHDPLMKDLGVDMFVDEWPLFEKGWFRRTWVVQEVFNAKIATVHCGQDTLPWPVLLRVNHCIRHTKLKQNSGYKAVMPPLLADLFDFKTNLSCGQIDRPAHMGILEILIRGLDLDATDPRDKIFTMLQFGEETQKMDLLPPELRPNYHKSTAQVFSDFTRWWIVAHRSLRVLSAIQAEFGRTWQETSCIQTSYPVEGRPSWSLWYRGHSNWAKGILGLSADSPYHAAADTTPDIDIIIRTQGSLYLPLLGRKISTIEKILPYPYYHPHLSHEDLHDVYITIFDPINETGKWIRSLFSEPQTRNKYHMPSELPHLHLDHQLAHNDYSKATGAIECHSNCFFNTPDGLIGLCPFSARPGDRIVVLHGGKVPYVLRQQGVVGITNRDSDTIRYEFVGECYLRDYMEGRAIKEQREKNLPTEVFELV